MVGFQTGNVQESHPLQAEMIVTLTNVHISIITVIYLAEFPVLI